VLLAIAFVVGLVLWVTMGTDGGAPSGNPGTTAVAGQTGTEPSTVAPLTGGSILSVRSFDPEGDDGAENEAQVPLVIDGNPDTAWQTVCYGDKYLGGKRGVGVIADLGADRTGTLTIDLGSAPYQLRVYGAVDGVVPTTFDAWGSPIDTSHGTDPTTLTVAVSQPVRYLLVSFVELGTNNDCAKNPFRGSIRELTFG
jgi:hypothetical protein